MNQLKVMQAELVFNCLENNDVKVKTDRGVSITLDENAQKLLFCYFMGKFSEKEIDRRIKSACDDGDYCPYCGKEK